VFLNNEAAVGVPTDRKYVTPRKWQRNGGDNKGEKPAESMGEKTPTQVDHEKL